LTQSVKMCRGLAPSLLEVFFVTMFAGQVIKNLLEWQKLLLLIMGLWGMDYESGVHQSKIVFYP